MKRAILIIMLIHAQFCVLSQNYFQKIYGSVYDEGLINIEKTDNSDFLLLGGWVVNNNRTDLYIVKIDTTGNPVNQFVVQSGMDKSMVYMDEVNPDEYFYLGSLGDPGMYNGKFGYVKTDSNGNIIESKQFEYFPGYCHDAIKVGANEYIMVGRQLVLKVSLQGDTIASKIIDKPGNYNWLDLMKISRNPITNNLAIIGQLQGDRYNFMVICLDENLIVLWQKIYNLSSFDLIQDISFSGTNDIFIVGLTVDTIINNNAYSKAFIWKINASGDSLWYHDYSGMDSIQLESIREIPVSGDLVVTGEYNCNTDYPTSCDGYFMRTDSTGEVIIKEPIGGDDYDSFYKQWVADPPSVYLFGSTRSYYADHTDLYVVKTDENGYIEPITGLHEKSISGRIAVSPNPFLNELKFSNPTNQDIDNIKIYNAEGKEVFENNNVNSPGYTVFTSYYGSGIYFYIIGLSDGMVLKGKIIKR